MDEHSFYLLQEAVIETLESKLLSIDNKQEVAFKIERVAKTIDPSISEDDLKRLTDAVNSFTPVDKYLYDERVEDIMINNTKNIFLYTTTAGGIKIPEKLNNRQELETFVKKLKMYATTGTSNSDIYDAHLPNGSRVNIVNTPMGADVTIRNYKEHAFSVIDLVNAGELNFNLAARLWLYAEGLGVRPANMLFGGIPAAGKTTLLNAMFSFFRPEERVVVIEETYELNTETQENCVRLETNPNITTRVLVQNALRMRPDRIIIGEVRGEEAKDMMTAMNIGRICMSTIHANTSREVITRLEHTPMGIEKEIIPLIDALLVVSQAKDEEGKLTRKISQVSEVSGIETQVLLSDLYSYNFKSHTASNTLPSVTYRDLLSKLADMPPNEILEEERRRARILDRLNKLQVRDIKSINEFCKSYYENPDAAIKKIGLNT